MGRLLARSLLVRRAGLILLAGLLAGCALTQPVVIDASDENWRIVCRVLYTGFGRSTTVYLKLEQHDRPVEGRIIIDDQCKVTIEAGPRAEPPP